MSWLSLECQRLYLALRIPMRGYEVLIRCFIIGRKLVTNPHAGL